jgi:copper resistance protein B
MSAPVSTAMLVLALLAGWLAPSHSEARPPDARPQQQEGHADHGAEAAPAADSSEETDHSMPAPQTIGAGAGIPPLTDADRAAAFPDVEPHALPDNALQYYVLLDQLEFQSVDDGAGALWDATGWFGRDVSRFRFRSEGEGHDGSVGHAEAHLLYGRAIARWWDVVAGVRQDVRPGPAQTWAAVGIQGVAPYWFEVEATAYVGASGRTHLRLETEYELLLTNRLILQPRIEIDLYGKEDAERGVGRGLSAAEAGLRIRYEVRREVAPYVGVVWDRKFFGTAAMAEAAGESAKGARLVAGARLWF